MAHKYSKSYFHDSEKLRRFVDDHKDRFTLSAGGQIVEQDLHMAVKLNASMLKLNNISAFTATDNIYSDIELTSKVNNDMAIHLDTKKLVFYFCSSP